MNSLVRNKLLTGFVILLLIANIATIVMFWIGMRKGHPRPHQQAKEFLIKELALNDIQQKQYRDMVDEHRSQSKTLNGQIRNCKDTLFDLLSQQNISDSSRNYLMERIASLNSQLDLITFEHFKKLRAICNTDQQQRFDKIIKDVLRMMAAPLPGGRPPGPGPGRPEGPGGPPPGEEEPK